MLQKTEFAYKVQNKACNISTEKRDEAKKLSRMIDQEKPWGRQGKWRVERETYFEWTNNLTFFQVIFSYKVRLPFDPPLALAAPGLDP